MHLGFSDLEEAFESESELYDSSCSLLATSDDVEYYEAKSDDYDTSTSLLKPSLD